jgi:hypothetical protein
MNKTYIIIIVSMVLILFGGAYFTYEKTLGQFWTTERTIKADLTKQTKTFRIDIDPEAQYPHGINLKMNGNLNGKGIVSYGWSDSAMYMLDTIEDDFDLKYRTDWYNDLCFIKYQSITATIGILNIDCEIYSSKK